MSKNTLIKGTIILTIAGLLTRVLGFFYRIFLSNAMGSVILGTYQLIFPVLGISFTIFASGIQTAISKLIASERGNGQHKNIPKILYLGSFLSFSLALTLSLLIYYNSDWIAIHILNESSCASSLKILSYAFPFCGITACINGYYYGLKQTAVPASSQLLEQTVRIIVVYFLSTSLGNGDTKLTSELAVLGLVIGEIASHVYNVFSLYISKSSREIHKLSRQQGLQSKNNKTLLKELTSMTLPLTGNRLLISILHSVEAILIPTMLKKHGLSNAEALSIYGVLTGMTIPFLLFPTAITNSLAVLLLPTISEAQALQNKNQIKNTSAISIKYSIQIGILSTGLFVSFGKELGNIIFHNQLAGSLLATIAWLCPFLYVTTTLGSIINGLGLANLSFANNMISMLLRIVMIFYFIPLYGIWGYLFSFLVSQLLITTLDGIVIAKYISPPFEVYELVLKPSFSIALTSYFIYQLYQRLYPSNHELIIVLLFCFFLCLSYLILLFLTKAITFKELK